MKSAMRLTAHYCLFYAITAIVVCLILWAVAHMLVMGSHDSEFGRAATMLLLGYVGCMLSVVVAILLTLLVLFLNWVNKRTTQN